jgi:putative hemolysin
VVELLDLPVEEDSFDTLNGLLISLLDKIPNDGERAKIHAYGYDFLIQKVEERTVREVLVKKAKPLA